MASTAATAGNTNSPFFSGAVPQIATGTQDPGFFSGVLGILRSGINTAAQAAAEVLPVWTRKTLEEQTGVQTRDPTFDQRYAQERVGEAHASTVSSTNRTATTTSLVPGVSNAALVMVAVAVAGIIVVMRVAK